MKVKFIKTLEKKDHTGEIVRVIKEGTVYDFTDTTSAMHHIRVGNAVRVAQDVKGTDAKNGAGAAKTTEPPKAESAPDADQGTTADVDAGAKKRSPAESSKIPDALKHGDIKG
jgi:hypothetical protein